jgi:hypothetical protein
MKPNNNLAEIDFDQRQECIYHIPLARNHKIDEEGSSESHKSVVIKKTRLITQQTWHLEGRHWKLDVRDMVNAVTCVCG